jgi:hypothetical protein
MASTGLEPKQGPSDHFITMHAHYASAKQANLRPVHSPQNTASTGPEPKQGPFGHDVSTLHTSAAPLSPNDTQPLLEMVAVL